MSSRDHPSQPPADGAPRPLPIDRHPLRDRSYLVATPAIERFYELVERCLRHRIPGALVFGEPRLGKTYAIDYIRLLLARSDARIPTFQLQAHHRTGATEGAFFSAMLRAVGHPEPEMRFNSQRRDALNKRILEAAHLRQSSQAALFCDEAQRFTFNEYEWLRDVQDDLAAEKLRLSVFLVGQPELLTRKQAFQKRRQNQVVARLMVEELQFRGIRSAAEAATCLSGYGGTEYPDRSGWTFTRFFLPRAHADGLRLADAAHGLWNAFLEAHRNARLRGDLEIPMDYFTRAVEIALFEALGLDRPNFRIGPDLWAAAVDHCGYAAAQKASDPPPDGPS